jgi:S1-C subfamily serine protease
VALFVALLLSLAWAPAQQTGTLKVTVTINGADGAPRSVPRHALLISDAPVTAAPQRYVTKADGTINVTLRAGSYTVESDDPFIFGGKSYQWSQLVKVKAGAESTLALTAANAMIEAAPANAKPSAADAPAPDADLDSALLLDWQTSTVTIWGPRTYGAGFLFDARGLIATNQRLVGTASTVEVQFSATKKVAGRVVASDPNKNVAIVWIDPKTAEPAKPMTLAFAQADKAAVAERDKVYSFEGRIGEAKDLASGTVSSVSAHTVGTDLQLDRASAGMPVVNGKGEVVAITTAGDEASVVNELSPRAVRIDDARQAIAEAEKKLDGQPPAATLLPVDPARPFPEDALKAANRGHPGSISAYMVSATDFDVAIITPPLAYAAFHEGDHQQFNYGGNPAETAPAVRALQDFGPWNEYVADAPPVVMIRVTPKLGENFWTTVARGAAQTQGVAIPAIKRVKANFGSLKLACGDTETLPIHQFRIEHRSDEGPSLIEGFFVFDVAAFAPQCGTVKVTIFSDKAGDKGDVKVVDAKIVQQVWDDFAAYRAAASTAK